MNSTTSVYIIFSNSTQIDSLLADVYYLYIHPVLFVMATIFNIICAVVLGQRELIRTGGVIFKYLFLNQITSAASTLLEIGLTLLRCGSLCSTSTSYFSQIYAVYGIYIIAQILFIFESFLQATTAYQTYLSIVFRHKRLNELISSPKFIITAFLLFCILAPINYLNALVLQQTEVQVLSTNVTLVKSVYVVLENANSRIIVLASAFFTIVLTNFFLLWLIVVNVGIFVELRRMMSRKKFMVKRGTLVGSMKMTNNVTAQENKTHNSNSVSANDTGVGKNKRLSSFQGQVENWAALEVKKLKLEKESERRRVIMLLWISVMFCSCRIIQTITILIGLGFSNKSLQFRLASVFNLAWTAIVYISNLFVYLRTNKMFKRKFEEVVLLRRKKIGLMLDNHSHKN